MSITRTEVEHIAKLAALALDEASLPALTKQIVQILEYVSQLEAVEDDRDPAPPGYPGPRQPLRADTMARASFAIPLEQMAPAFRDGLFLVPRLGAVGADGASTAEPEE